jgi:hypothetical protein
MATQAQKANYALWFHEAKSVTSKRALNLPARASIYAWCKEFTQSDFPAKESLSEAAVDSAAATWADGESRKTC